MKRILVKKTHPWNLITVKFYPIKVISGNLRFDSWLKFSCVLLTQPYLFNLWFAYFTLLCRLFTFPSKIKNNNDRLKWRKFINRREITDPNKLWRPKKQSRVCSKHFIGGKPVHDSPYPTELLGYDATSKIKNVVGGSSRRKLSFHAEQCTTNDNESSLPQLSEFLIDDSIPDSCTQDTDILKVSQQALQSNIQRTSNPFVQGRISYLIGHIIYSLCFQLWKQ